MRSGMGRRWRSPATLRESRGEEEWEYLHLSFFKPATPTADVKTPAKGLAKGIKAATVVKGEQNDDLFIRHGGYELDLSEPEDDDGDDSAWSVERTLAGSFNWQKETTICTPRQ